MFEISKKLKLFSSSLKFSKITVAKNMPNGICNFRKIRNGKYFYVDKTRFIEKIENDDDYLTFYRPRRFGKSLLLSTLDYYYNHLYAKDFAKIFRGTYIGEHPTPLRSSFSVISLDFSSVDSSSFDNCVKDIKSNLKVRITDFLRRNKIILSEPIDFNATPASIMEQFLFGLRLLKHPLFILIDEYDHFTNELLAKDVKDFKSAVEAGGFFRDLFSAIKIGAKEELVDRIFITGIAPLTLDSLTSGFNISTDITSSNVYNDLEGFTRQEAESLINDAFSGMDVDKIAILYDLTRLYDGYLFSACAPARIFNSAMTLYYLSVLL
jgi:hypothetical protein